MYQTLTIDVYKNMRSKEPLVSIHSENKGSTTGTIESLIKLIERLNSINTESISDDEVILSLIRYVEANGGRIDESDIEYAHSRYNDNSFEYVASGDFGVITLRKDSSNKLKEKTDFISKVFINDKKVKIDSYTIYPDFLRYKKSLEEELLSIRFQEENIPIFSEVDISNIFGFEKLEQVYRAINDILDKGMFEYKDSSERIISFIY